MNEILLVIISTTVVYLFLIAAVTVFGKNEFSQLSVTDLIFILLLSEAVQNGLIDGSWKSLWIAIVAATTLFILNYLLRLGLYKNKKVRKLLEGDPVLLIYKGKPNKKNMEKERLTMEELESAVRGSGIEKISEVKLAVRETEGNISIIPFDAEELKTKDKKKGAI